MQWIETPILPLLGILWILQCCCQVQSDGHNIRYTLDGLQRKPISVDSCNCTECSTEGSAYNSGTNNEYENVAFNKPVIASSIRDINIYPACAVNNGLHSATSRFSKNTNCAVTAFDDMVPWIQIDLGYVITLRNITVFRSFGSGRDEQRPATTDGGPGLLRSGRDAIDRWDKYSALTTDIFVDGRPCYRYPPQTDKLAALNLPRAINIDCEEQMTGRYVRMQKRSETGMQSWHYLSICDIHIWVCKPGTHGHYGEACNPCPEDCDYVCDNLYGCAFAIYNMAFMKKASQQAPGIGSPANAVNPIQAGSMEESCTGLQNVNESVFLWWRVDLAALYKIFFVILTGADSMKNFKIVITIDTTEPAHPTSNQLCMHSFLGILNDKRISLSCRKNMTGRYIWITTTKSMKFCVFEAFGHRVYELPRGYKCRLTSQYLGCDDDTECQRGKCRSKVGKSCTATDDCVIGTVCENGRCFLDYNSPCDPHHHECLPHAFCEHSERQCKSKLDQRCDGDTREFCPPHAHCDILNRCGIKRAQSCDQSTECTSGASCVNNHCICKAGASVPNGDHCRALQGRVSSSCQGDTMCVGDTACRDSACTCNERSTPFAEDFSCRIKSGGNCNINDDCNTGAVCESNQCRSKAGKPCNTIDDCATGTVCENERCLLDYNLPCDPHFDECRTEGFCEHTTRKCKIRPGQRCDNDKREFCPAHAHCDILNRCGIKRSQSCGQSTECTSGASCVDNHCSCKVEASVENGDHCRARQGRVSSSCQNDTMCLGDTVCRDSACSCDEMSKPFAGDFSCTPENMPVVGGSSSFFKQNALWIGMFLGLFLLLLLIVIALLVWHRRKKHDERMDLQMKGQQAIQSLVSLEESIVESGLDTDQDAMKSTSSSAAIRSSMGSVSSVGVPSVTDTSQSVVETSKFEHTE